MMTATAEYLLRREVSMEAFLRRHDVDVGKTFGIVLLAIMAQEIYWMVFRALLADKFILNVGIIILFFLGRGMYRHANIARQWALGLTWALLVLLVLCAFVAPFRIGREAPTAQGT